MVLPSWVCSRLSSERIVAQFRIEVGERLVEQEQPGIAHDRAPDRDPLALAARELARQALQQRHDVEHRGRTAHPAARSRFLPTFAPAQPEGDVLVDVHVRIERVVLEHHGNIAIPRRHVVDHQAIDRDRAAIDRPRARRSKRRSAPLPPPEGPTSTANSPSGMSRSTPRTACVWPIELVQLADRQPCHATCVPDFLRGLPIAAKRVI